MANWQFTENTVINVWTNQLTIPTGAQTYGPNKAQHMKPYYPYAQTVKGIAIHRWIIKVSEYQPFTSTDIEAGIVIQQTDSVATNYGYYIVTDVSPFPYDAGGSFPVDYQMLIAMRADF